MEIFQGPSLASLNMLSARISELCFSPSWCIFSRYLHFSGGVCHSSSWNLDALPLQFLLSCVLLFFTCHWFHTCLHAAPTDVSLLLRSPPGTLNAIRETITVPCFPPLSFFCSSTRSLSFFLLSLRSFFCISHLFFLFVLFLESLHVFCFFFTIRIVPKQKITRNVSEIQIKSDNFRTSADLIHNSSQ